MSVRVDADLVVIGAGMAGMVSASAAALEGAVVVVIEKTPKIGGSALLSGGFVWTARDLQTLRRENPLGDPVLGQLLIDGFDDGLEWIGRRLGVSCSDPVELLVHGRGVRVDIVELMAKARYVIERASGWIAPETSVQRLLLENNAVVGALVDDHGGTADVRAPWTVLSTGGFQGSRELRSTYLGENAAKAVVRSNPASVGDGLRFGLEAGAATSDRMTGFYGHVMASPLPSGFHAGDYLRLSQTYVPFGVLLDRAGRRFTDESRGYYWCAQALCDRAQPRAVVIIDSRVYDERASKAPAPGMEEVDLPAEAAHAGANVAAAATIRELAQAIASWGYAATAVRSSIEEFNDAMDRGALTVVPRVRNREPVDRAPFHAVEVEPAITFTHGGLRVDERAQVLDAHREPVPGLLAAGADTGGTFSGGYAGGLALALVTGRRAAKTATEHAART